MAKIRVYELAKELNIDAKEITDFLGEEFKSMSGLEDAEVEKVKNRFAPKKKKPVLLFRPENASGSLGKKPAAPAQKPATPSQKPVAAAQKPLEKPKAPAEPRKVIRPNVPTTAEMYKENASEGHRKIEDTTDTVKKLKREEELKQQEEAAKKAEALAAKAAQEEALKKAQEEATKAETVKAEPEKAEAPKAEAPKTEEKKKPAFVFSKNTREGQSDRPRTDRPYGDRPQGDRPQRPFNRDGQNRTFGDRPQGDRPQRPFNRDGQSRPFGDRPQGDRPQRPFNRDGQSRPFGDRPQGDRPQRSFNRDGQGFEGKDKDARDNRGIFSKDNRNGNANIRYNQDNSGASQTFSKADVRGKKNNTKNNDKDRKNYDGNGKREENFKNLSKEPIKKQVVKKEEEVIKMISLPAIITMKDLADKMKMKPADLIKKLFMKGKMVTLNTELSYEEAEEIALEYEILCEKEVEVDVIEELLKEEDEDEGKMVKRPPVVCVMGHVDHGKTSLLDAIRSAHVTDKEAGGITQHIGAYMVECNGEPITFLDTPGHEAFTAMRMRGAQATDIAVLVVAADDGVMPQTIEAINHAKAAGVEVIVAVNKIDKPTANIDHVKQELSEYNLIPEDWGGSTVFVPVSAKMHQNIDQLLEMILLVTEVKELKANPNRAMRGLVIEAKLDKGRGPVATVLVQKGTLKPGDFISCGSYYGRVRAMLDADGNQLKSATPSTPVEILGLNGVPNAGEVCVGHKNEKDARTYADTFIAEEKKKMLAETKKRLTMDSLFAEIKAGNIQELPIVVKADVQGSVEAVRTSLEKLSNDEVAVKVIHGGVGAISESDVTLASASNAIIIGFNVKPDTQAKMLADAEKVDLKLYRVIYQAIDDVEAAMKGMLAPVYEEKIIGHAEVRMTFKASGVGVIAGSYVTDGILERGCQIRIKRDKDEIYDGPLASLKRFKDDAKEVKEGFECGVVCEKFNDLQEGDLIEAYKMVQVERQ